MASNSCGLIGILVKIDVPKLPWANWPIELVICSIIDLSRPSSLLNFSWSANEDDSPIMTKTGSPGIR